MKIRVVAPYDWTPPLKRQLTFARKPGAEPILVKRDEGTFAVAAGKAVEVTAEQPEPNDGSAN